MFRHLLELPTSNQWALLLVIIFASSGIYELRGAHEQRTQADHSPVEVMVRTKPRPGLRVVSGDLVYEEELYKGGLRTRYWSPTGLIKPETFLERAGDELPRLDEPIACSFGLSVDGQDLWDNWSWISAQELPCEAKQGIRLAREDSRKCRHVMVELANEIRPIHVKVHTQVDGNSFLKRWLEITNTGKSIAAIGGVYPMSGYLFAGRHLKEDLPSGAASVFSILRPASFDPLREADFRWSPLPDGSYSYGNSKWGLPFAVVQNGISGELFLIHFAWSGHYAFEFYNDHNPAREDAWLYFRVGLAGPGPFRVLQPGETVITPAVHIGHMLDDLDGAIQASHQYLRESVLPSLPANRFRPVEINSWGFVEQDISEDMSTQNRNVRFLPN